MKPAFIGIGAQKCASTWVFRVLDEHPACAMAKPKEVDFFSYRYDRGIQWYERHFDADATADVRGEISPSYFCDYDAPVRAAAYSADLKIIVTLRDPVDRIVSNHRHELRVGHLRGGDTSLRAGLLNNPMYIEQSRYTTHVKRWLEYFPREQVHFILFEEVRSTPHAAAQDLFAFLGLDTEFESTAANQSFNKGFTVRSEKLARIKDRLYRVSQSGFGRLLWRAAALLGVRALYRGVNKQQADSGLDTSSAELLQHLRREFEDDITELSSLIDRDLSAWKSR